VGCDFNENKANEESPVSYTPRMNESNEKESGGWNKYEIVCKEGNIEASVTTPEQGNLRNHQERIYRFPG
jgi:hypothetical protein